MFEHRTDPPLSLRGYFRLLSRHSVLAGGILFASLGLGMAGYHGFEGLGWIDSFVNASMILSGMGPLAPLATAGGRLFAGGYALFSGVAFLTTVGVLLAPTVHRGLHRFHIESRTSRQ
jgi:hypothetical protein